MRPTDSDRARPRACRTRLKALAATALAMIGLLAASAPGVAAEPVGGAPAASSTAESEDIVERLRAVPGLTIVEEQAAPEPYRFFVLSYRQPADHNRPELATFEQRVTLLHKSTDRPTVLYTHGYSPAFRPPRGEVTRLIDGNQLTVEHRFFGTSRPEPVDWSTLNIWQASTDYHRLVAAFRPIYSSAWISTGVSKGAMASVYFRRFYPSDVDGTVAYVAVNDAINREDSRYDDFFDHVGDDPACRAALTSLQQEALGPRRSELVDRFESWATANGQTFDRSVGTVDRAFEGLVIFLPWSFWQFLGEASCADIPAPTASTEVIYSYLDEVVGFGGSTDQAAEPYIPYAFQAGTQLGWPILKLKELDGLLRYPDIFEPLAYAPSELEKRFEPQRMVDIDRWVRQDGRELLFVYGENDPWGAEPFELGPGTRDSYSYEAAGANHFGATIAALTPEEQAVATAALQRWAGLAATQADPAAPRPPREHGPDNYNPATKHHRP